MRKHCATSYCYCRLHAPPVDSLVAGTRKERYECAANREDGGGPLSERDPAVNEAGFRMSHGGGSATGPCDADSAPRASL